MKSIFLVAGAAAVSLTGKKHVKLVLGPVDNHDLLALEEGRWDFLVGEKSYIVQGKTEREQRNLDVKNGLKGRTWDLGNGEGSEKWDVTEEMARFSTDQKDFHMKMALNPGLPALNSADTEPTGHPLAPGEQAGVSSDNYMQTATNSGVDPIEIPADPKRSRKQEDEYEERMYWYDLESQASNQRDFHEKAKAPKISNFNHADSEPQVEEPYEIGSFLYDAQIAKPQK